MSSMATLEHRGPPGVSRLVGLAFLVGIVFAGVAWGAPAAEQGQKASEQPCAEGVVGYLGITGIDCRGCSLTLTQESTGWKRAWSLAIEPRITEIAPGSPAAGVLQVGDEIVGIDGVLITAAEGGRRFASIEPNQTVTIRYRRRGRTADAMLRAETRCGQFVDGMKTDPITWRSAAGVLQLAGGIRIQMNDSLQRNVTIGPAGDALDVTVSPRTPVTGRREVGVTEGRLGLRWSCQGSCSATRKADGRRVWRFSRPLRVSGIEAGGPADTAGVRIGDQLTAVNGHRIESKRGGEAFSDVRPGQPMQLTLRGPDGRERTVTVVPAAREHEDAPE